jgi:hypothetical protein
MPDEGITLDELLKQQNYDVFFMAIHELSEVWIMALLIPAQVGQLIGRITGQELPPELQAMLQPAVKRCQELAGQLSIYPDQVRCVLWGFRCVDGQADLSQEESQRVGEIIRQRWQPCDGAAWDRCFQQAADVLKPALPLYDAMIQELNQMHALLPTAGTDSVRTGQVLE